MNTGWFTTASGVSIFYRDFLPETSLAGLTVVCLHGFLRNSRDFLALGEYLSGQGIRVIAPDFRGRGQSPRFTDVQDYHYDLLCADVIELLDDLAMQRCAFVGIALGGYVAMDLARIRPDLVAGILLNDLGAEVGEASANKMAANVGAADYSYEEAVARMRENFGQTYPDLDEQRWPELMLRAYAEVSPGRYARDLDMLTLLDAGRMKKESPDSWSRFLETRDVPVVLLRGALSEFFTADCAQRMLDRHPRAELFTVPECGHPPLLDEPVALEALDCLFERVLDASSTNNI